MKKRLLREGRYPNRLTRHYLIFEWKRQIEKDDPNAFHVPFRPKEIDYEVYLSSAIWNQIRQTVLNGAQWRCAGCGADATVVHHRDYRPRVLSGEDITPLVALCAGCHKFIHEPRKESWQDEDNDLMALVANYEATHGENSN